MTSNRFRPGNYQPIRIPASKGLINTSITPQRLDLKWAQDVENMIPTQGAKLSKRHGVRQAGVTGLGDTEVIVHMDDYTASDGTAYLVGFTSLGNIYSLNLTTGAISWHLESSGSSVNGTFGTCHFNQKLIIFNGTDSPKTFDGTSVANIQESLFDPGTNLTYISSTQFKIDTLSSRGAMDYPNGRTVKITLDTGVVTGVVASTSYTSPTLTVTLTTAAITSTTILDVAFVRAIPNFSFIYPSQDRLWALSPGQLHPNAYRGGTDGMKVFFTFTTNVETVWSDTDTLNNSYINVADKHIINDELLAISSYQNALIFFGREACQLWTGRDPTASGSLSWAKTVKVGLLHPFLIQELEQDLVFYTRDGTIRSFTRVTQTTDIETRQDVGSNMIKAAKQRSNDILAKESRYRLARSFRYPRASFFGFKLFEECHIHYIDKESVGWARFTSIFSAANAYAYAANGHLYIAADNILYIYADDENRYNDDNLPFRWSWWTPWIQPKIGSRWANRKIELEIDPGFVATVEVRRYKNGDEANHISQFLTLPGKAAFWDEADWDVAFWDGDENAKYSRGEDKFIAYTFSYQVTGRDTIGPIDLVSLNIFGQVER